MVPADARAVLDCWFLPADAAGHGRPRAEWFRKDSRFDDLIRNSFGERVDQALNGGLRAWDATAEGRLARILILDQFTRNIFRDTPRAFAGDALALGAAAELTDHGDDRLLQPVQRQFAYMPFMHAENLTMQERSVALFRGLHEDTGAFADALDYAIRHRAIVARFGRFPHRNAILGRASSTEEASFLKEPGSSF